MNKKIYTGLIMCGVLILPLAASHAQEDEPDDQQPPESQAEAGPSRTTVIGKELTFDMSQSSLPPDSALRDIFWDFGDGVKTTGSKVTHAYQKASLYHVKLRITTTDEVFEDTTEATVLSHIVVMTTDSIATESEIENYKQQAAEQDTLLLVLGSQSTGPEATIAEEVTQQLINLRQDVARSRLIIAYNSGSVGTSALSQFAQQLQSTRDTADALPFSDTGIIILSNAPLGVVAPTAQTVFDQLQPSYVMVTRPSALDLLLAHPDSEAAKNILLNSPIEYRLLGTFSARTVSDIGPTNFLSFGISFLINRGVPINSIVLILMLPLIATILAFARQIIGIKALGLVTPVMTTLSFLVMGLSYGIIVFAVVLLSGTLVRVVLRRLRLLYLHRMALVLTSASIAILLLLGIGAAINPAAVASFSIFPALIMIILAEEFIAVQFSAGAKTATIATAWTLLLAIVGYYIMNWELLGTFIISYPEIVLLTIPVNIILGRWSGLRLTEYIRFRQLLRHENSP